jgi:ribosomal protein L32
MGVSFQTPTRIAPEQVASAVRGHEMEHVVREQAKARREDRRVVSQSVTIHTDICPECGKTFVSGGTTRTVTAASREAEQPAPEKQEEGFSVMG